MYVKIFRQIYDSTVADDYDVCCVFIHMLNLADARGVIDMTPASISRITGCPMETLMRAIDKLQSVDKYSRSNAHGGRRIVLLDDHRDWGWFIVNYTKYRAIRDEDHKREYMRNYMRSRRDSGKHLSSDVSSVKHPLATDVKRMLASVVTSETRLAHTEAEAEAEAEEESIPPIVPPSGSETRRETTKATSADASFAVFWEHAWRKDAKQAAFRAWVKQCTTSAILQSVLDAVIAQSAYYLAREPDKRPYMSTWLNQQRWKDELGADPAQTIPLQKTRLQRIMESI